MPPKATTPAAPAPCFCTSAALDALQAAPVNAKLRWVAAHTVHFASPDGAGQVKADDAVVKLFPEGTELRKTPTGFVGTLPEGAARHGRAVTHAAPTADALARALSAEITG